MTEEGKVKKAIVALNESAESFHALSWALDFVVRPGDQLVFVHSQAQPPAFIIGPAPVLGTALGAPLPPDLLRSFREHQDSVTSGIMNRAREMCKGRGLDLDFVTAEGDPRESICEAVSKMNADMLIVGSHGYGTIKRTFLGSVSDYCAHHVKCPILIVKKPDEEQA